MEKRTKEILLILLSDMLYEVKQETINSGDYYADIKEALTAVINFLDKSPNGITRNKFEQWKAKRQDELKRRYGKLCYCRDCLYFSLRKSGGCFGNCSKNSGMVQSNNLACELFKKGGEGK